MSSNYKYVLMDSEIRTLSSKSDCELNIGDMIQSIAIENLYNYMGLNDKNIVHMTLDKLSVYAGEKLIFPFNYMICDGNRCPYIDNKGDFIFSEDIIPVFLGFSIKKGYFKFTESNLAYLKRHEPIGCRDYCTYITLKDMGVKSYIGGCLTATLPKRKYNNGSKIFFVEVPKGIEKYIPDSIKDDIEFIFHQQNITDSESIDYYFSREYAKKYIDQYSKEAKLVVCSRLHAALPCLALGIPTIVVKEYFGYPFDLVKKFTKTYKYNEFRTINWDKGPAEFEDYKKKALRCAKKRLMFEDADKDIIELHDEYSDLYPDGYEENKMDMDVFEENIHNRYRKDDKFDYAIWGITENAEWIYNYIMDNYPNARLVKVIDAFKKEIFHGIQAELPDVLSKTDSFITIASTINVSAVAEQLFPKIGKDRNQWLSVTDGVLLVFD